MIGTGAGGRERVSPVEKMGHMAYWREDEPELAWTHWAMRTAVAAAT
jgi:hypothetical protein